MSLDYYADVIDRIRRRHRTLIINLTTGPGGRFVPSEDEPRVAAPGTTLLHPAKRVEHIAALRPDVCSLDLNTMNSGGDVVINTPANVRKMAKVIRAAGVMPELEIFDSGDLNWRWTCSAKGCSTAPACGPSCWASSTASPPRRRPSSTRATCCRRAPTGPPSASAAPSSRWWPGRLAGGHVRVGLEDNLYLEKGVLAPDNAALVAKARGIVESLGGEIASPAEARRTLGLRDA